MNCVVCFVEIDGSASNQIICMDCLKHLTQPVVQLQYNDNLFMPAYSNSPLQVVNFNSAGPMIATGTFFNLIPIYHTIPPWLAQNSIGVAQFVPLASSVQGLPLNVGATMQNLQAYAEFSLPNEAELSPIPPQAFEPQNSTTRLTILRNGTCRGPILINGQFYLILNTCAFDCISQILMSCGLDETSYSNFIKYGPRNSTLRFIKQFMEEGASADVYHNRTALLLSLFSYKVVSNQGTNGSIYRPHKLDMWSTIGEMWSTCFKSCPSICTHYNCSNCGQYKLSSTMLTAHITKRLDPDSRMFEESIQSMVTRPRCYQCQSTSVVTVSNIIYFNQICFEFFVWSNMLDLLECTLAQFPTTIHIENNCRYRLGGIISCKNGHFTAYCRKANNCWEEHDDSAWSTRTVGHDLIVKLAAAIFIRIQ